MVQPSWAPLIKTAFITSMLRYLFMSILLLAPAGTRPSHLASEERPTARDDRAASRQDAGVDVEGQHTADLFDLRKAERRRALLDVPRIGLIVLGHQVLGPVAV